MSNSSKSKLDFRSRVVFFWIKCLKWLGLPKKIDQASPGKILVVSTTGIGDTLWSTPALSLLRKKFQNSKIDVLTSGLGAQVLKGNPHLDSLYIVKKSNISLLGLYFKLKPQKYDTIIIFHISDRWLIPFCYFLGSQKIIGFKRHAKVFAPLLTHSHEVGLRHPIIQRNALIETLGVQEINDQIEVYPTSLEKKQAQEFLSGFSIQGTPLLIGVQPGASQAFKQWPISHFIDLVKKLSLHPNLKLIIFGSAQEAHLAQAIQKEVPSALIASGRLSLRVAMALIGKMNLFISNDTGPMHLALAQKIPLVSIFSPTAHNLCWPHLTAPWFRLVQKPKTCETCVGHRCKKPYCLERITPQEVGVQVYDHLQKLYGLEEVKVNFQDAFSYR